MDWRQASKIKEYHDLSPEAFWQEVRGLHQPAVLRAALSDWPLVQKGQLSHQALCQHLKRFSNTQPVSVFAGAPDIQGRFSYNEDLSGFNFERYAMELDPFLDKLLQFQEQKNADPQQPVPSVYAGAVNLDRHLPRLSATLPMPFIPDDIQCLASLWVGNRTRVAAHWDLPQNLACVVAGTRRFTLFPITELNNLYIGPLDRTLAGQPSSLVDFHQPDLQQFPRFAQAIPQAQIAELQPGDMLFIPSLWLHHVESLTDFGAMVNYWWREGPEFLETPFTTMMHALLTIRDLPEAERLAWREVFDHYIFQVNGDPMAHLPQNAKGLFGKIGPDSLQQIKSFLLQRLN